ncbi:hypothetical protein M0R19_03325 [Candidatus Pacearchaeota archaeon]|jgi:hypothetical protein|nr:hypothetical protein [Candidatus Pacearchaeota archaeon]
MNTRYELINLIKELNHYGANIHIEKDLNNNNQKPILNKKEDTVEWINKIELD